MRIAKIKVFLFGELSDKAKQVAIENVRKQNNMFSDYKNSVYEDAVTSAALFGLNIDEDNILHSGFSSQGDGASYTGNYCYVAGALEKVKSYAPQDKNLHSIVEKIEQLQEKFNRELTVRITRSRSSNYVHAYTMQFDLDYPNMNESFYPEDMKRADAIDNEIEKPFIDFANWIYKQLECAYEYEQSDENIADMLENSASFEDIEYTEDGQVFKDIYSED